MGRSQSFSPFFIPPEQVLARRSTTASCTRDFRNYFARFAEKARQQRARRELSQNDVGIPWNLRPDKEQADNQDCELHNAPLKTASQHIALNACKKHYFCAKEAIFNQN